ncbi:peptidylprolyl isomerase [Candidatus Curtissbacteria bacterium]|nr:peptidylprolyl isomerase [Candidatus Curtissbacteria bacterium]
MKKTYTAAPTPFAKSEIDGKMAVIKTKYGDIVIKLSSEAPLAATNFMVLAKDGFYDGLTFHRRVEGFVIQGGDPSGNGTGDPGYKFDDEPVNRDYKRGVVAMANSGPNTNGSQFFIMLADNPLPRQYTIFGDVVKGIEVVDKIQVGDVMSQVAIQ